jgi:flagellin-like protein
MNKRGLSGIVTTVLMVLIVIVAIIIIWMAVSGIFTGSDEKIEEESVITSISIRDDSVIIDPINSTMEFIAIRGKENGNVTAVETLIYNERGVSCKIKIYQNISTLESAKVYLNYSSCGFSNITRIEAHFIILGNQGQELGSNMFAVHRVVETDFIVARTGILTNKINGLCGSTKNSCINGTLNNPSSNSTHYLWQCLGLNGGTNASCSSLIPPSPINGVCSLTKDTCTAGTFLDKADNSTHYLWQCLGLNGGADVNCSLALTSCQLNNNCSVSPRVECKRYELDGNITVFFGYDNPNSISINHPIGTNNKFTPAPQDRGQPTIFYPGRNVSLFGITFNSSILMVWTLSGKTSTGSIATRNCTV